MSGDQEDDPTETTEVGEERSLTPAERAAIRNAREVLNGPIGDALRDGTLAANIEALAGLPAFDSARLVEGLMPSLNAAAMFPAFDSVRLVEGLMPSLTAAAMLPAFDTVRLVEGLMPSLTAAAMLPAFDSVRLVEGLMPSLTAAAMLPAFDTARLVEGLMPSLTAAAMLPAFDTARLVEGLMPSLNAAAMLPAFDTARLVEGLMPSLNAAAMLPAFDLGAIIRRALPDLTDEFFDRIRRGFERLVPRNLRSLDDLRYEHMTTVMREEGIPFVLVPDAVTAAALLDADDAGARRLVLVDRAEPIFEACEGILALCVDPHIAFPGSQVRQAIGAYRAGFPGPAQASAATVLDSVLYDHPEKTHRGYLVGSLTAKGGITRTAYTLTLDHVRLLTLTPISAVQIEDSRGKNQPRIQFSRHSTVHRVTEEQYTESNAVQAIMLATSLLGFIQDLW